MPALTFTALALLLAPPRLTRAPATTTRDGDTAEATGGWLIPPATLPRPRFPAPAPAPVPVPIARPVPAPAAPVRVDPAGPPLLGPQAMGDVIVLPWLDIMRPDIRALHTQAAGPVGARGVIVHPSHVLAPESAAVFWSWWPDPAGPTLGTLVVPDDVVARMTHHPADPRYRHGDLRIGPGVYTLRRQRHATALVED
jgi:hypothetical protein